MNHQERQLLEEKYGGKESAAFEADRARLAADEPLAYVIDFQPFVGLKIFLDSKPLIPRPETEWWTEQFAQRILERSAARHRAAQRPASRPGRVLQHSLHELRLLDLCAGSGAIGCALLKLVPEARLSFGEINQRHEATIRKNICENGLDETRADVRIGDLFAPFTGEKFDFIAANPPYIPEGRVLPASVAAHEPHEALFAGKDGLELIERIAAKLKEHLLPGGEAWIECDSPSAEAASKHFAEVGFATQILIDQFGRPRVIVVSYRR